jgi:tetratricopeptide (TPR) repeat protein
LAVARPALAQAPAPAAATDRQRRASELWKEGLARYNLDKQDEAIDFFTKAYEIYPFPDILFNLGQAHRRKGEWERARFYFLSYLREKPDADDRAEVEGWIHELEGKLAVPPAPASAPASAPVVLVPGPTRPPRPAPERWYDDTWGWILVGGGLAVGGVGVWAALDAARLEDAGGDELSRADNDARAHDRRVLAVVTGGVGAALLTTGIVKLVLHDQAPSVTVGVSRHGVSLGWTF